MNKAYLTILSIVVILLVFVAGAGFGIFYQKQSAAPQIEKTTTSIKILSSKTVPSIVAFGKVSNIDGRNITLSFSGDSITVAIADAAQISSYVQQIPADKATVGSQMQTQQQVAFKDIKIGDTLNISIKVQPDGQLLGQSVFVLPSFGNTPSATITK